MFTGELATRILAFVDNIDSNTAANRQRRRRVVADIQEKYDEIWNHRGWRWSMGNAAVVVGSGENSGLLPLDFGIIPKFGGVFVDGQPLHDLADTTMNQIHQGYITASNVGYAITGYSDSDQRGTIKFDVDGPLTATMFYKKRPPLLADKPPAVGLALVTAGALTGVMTYKTTYTTSDGFEHEASDPTSITAAAENVTVTAPSPGPLGEHNVTFINFYRKALSGVYHLLATSPVEGDVSIVYTDSTIDAVLILGAVLVSKSTLSIIPAKYHYTVVLPGVRSMRKQSQGDTRDFEKLYVAGLAEMVREERPFQSEVQQMPRWTQHQQW